MANLSLNSRLKSLLKSAPLRHGWAHPALLTSIGLHALLLLLPFPERAALSPLATASDHASDAANEADITQVSVTPLPPPSPSPSPSPTVQPSPPAALLQPRPLRPTTPGQILPPSSPVAKPAPLPPPISPASPTPAPLTAPASPSPPILPPTSLPFDLPLLAGAQTGCFGLGNCRAITDGTSFRAAGQTLEQQLVAQGYAVTPREDYEEAGRKVYQLTKGSETRYLNILSADLGNTVYLVTPQPISLSDLKTGETLQAELSQILAQIPSQPAAPAQVAQPDIFWTGGSARSEIVGNLQFVAGQQPEPLLSSLTAQLQAQSFTLTEAGGYGGGWLYEVTKGPYIGYLNLVPAPDQTGTTVILWNRLPD